MAVRFERRRDDVAEFARSRLLSDDDDLGGFGDNSMVRWLVDEMRELDLVDLSWLLRALAMAHLHLRLHGLLKWMEKEPSSLHMVRKE